MSSIGLQRNFKEAKHADWAPESGGLLLAADSGHSSILIFLDPTAAFNAVDKFEHLKKLFGVFG